MAGRSKWLTRDELATWRALSLLLTELPVALDRQLRRDAGLSFLEYYVLARIAEHDGHRAPMSDIAQFVNSELSRLSHLVKRLEGRGLVRRETHSADRRVTLVCLTDQGYALLVASAPGHVAAVRDAVFDQLDRPTQHALRGAATRIVAALNE